MGENSTCPRHGHLHTIQVEVQVVTSLPRNLLMSCRVIQVMPICIIFIHCVNKVEQKNYIYVCATLLRELKWQPQTVHHFLFGFRLAALCSHRPTEGKPIVFSLFGSRSQVANDLCRYANKCCQGSKTEQLHRLSNSGALVLHFDISKS